MVKGWYSAPEYHGPERWAAIKEQMEQFDRESAYFVAHQEELLREYPDQWVAIYGERVVGADPDRTQLVADLRRQGVPTDRTFIEFMWTNRPVFIL